MNRKFPFTVEAFRGKDIITTTMIINCRFNVKAVINLLKQNINLTLKQSYYCFSILYLCGCAHVSEICSNMTIAYEYVYITMYSLHMLRYNYCM